jgi:hypothetical protein
LCSFPLLVPRQGSDMDADALPRAHTCFNQIVVPNYNSFRTMYDKIKYAIDNSEGFAMT